MTRSSEAISRQHAHAVRGTGSRGPLCAGRQSLKSDALTEHTQTIETFIIHHKIIFHKNILLGTS